MKIERPYSLGQQSFTSILSGLGAFTLVELLVVISIAFVVLSLLIPAIAKAKDKARQALCRNNQGQIAKGTSMYLSDNNHRFMSPVKNGIYGDAVFLGTIGSGDTFSIGADERCLNPYVASSGFQADSPITVARCPNDRQAFGGAGAYRHTGTSYFSNHNPLWNGLQNATGGIYKDKTIKDSEVLQPARLILAFEHGALPYALNYLTNPAYPLGVGHYNHGKRGAFMLSLTDGHVAFQAIQLGAYTNEAYTFHEEGRH